MIATLENAINSTRFNSAQKNVQIQFENEFENAWIIGDPERLHQAMTNILTNAIKFTPENGKILVKAKPEGPAIHISVTDTGEGIPQEFLPFVFDRFRQADGSLTRRHGGLGLGLAIVRHIVQAFNGEIEAHSDGPGKGSTFILRFPLYHHPLISGETELDWAQAQ